MIILSWEHINGTTSATPGTTTTVTFPHRTRSLLIDNRSTTSNMYFSMDNGSAFKTIDPRGSVTIDTEALKTLVVKSDGASQSYEILNGYVYV